MPEPNTISTPEGDNELPPDVPLNPVPPTDIEVPRGNAPDKYRQPENPIQQE